MSLHAQVPTPATPTVPAEAGDPAGFGGWFLEYFTQPVATVLASLGIIGAALITYVVGSKNRKQLEEHHKATHTLAATQALRDRFTTITTQLADPAPAIRTAAISALEALADDWLDRNKPRETQACINVLCDYLRTPYEPPTRNPHLRKATRRTHRTKYDYTDTTHEYPHDDLDTRHAIVRIITAHLQPGHDHSWSAFDYDLTGAYLHDANLTGATFSGGSTSFSGATFGGETASFDGATFDGETASFDGATFGGETTSFHGATFNSRTVSFERSTFTSRNTWFDFATFSSLLYTLFDGATFSGGTASFRGATFSGGPTSFNGATFGISETILFIGATFDGRATFFNGATFGGRTFGISETTSFEAATFSSNIYTLFVGATFNSRNTWFNDAMFGISETTSFERATFGGEFTSFENPHAWVNVLVDWERHPDSGFGPLAAQPESIHPRKWPPVPTP